MSTKYLITGGLGFIGSNFIRLLLKKYDDIEVVNLDAATYAGNPQSLQDLVADERLTNVHGNINDKDLVESLVKNKDIVVNFAAESHVDRSIRERDVFLTTNANGVNSLLGCALNSDVKKFLQVSTDEVYGSIEKGSFKETDILEPSSPYSASKAAGDLIARSYFTTYGLPVIITRCTNNYGPYQFPEKLIPFFITNLLEDKKIGLYGDGLNIRDWIYVDDHCAAIDHVLGSGIPGEIYNIAGNAELTNLEITRTILDLLGKDESMIEFVKDRPGHDRRYSLDADKLKDIGWMPKHDFKTAIRTTVDWYVSNKWWWQPLKEGFNADISNWSGWSTRK